MKKKTLYTNLFTLAALSALFISCNDDEAGVRQPTYTAPTAQEFADLRTEAYDVIKQEFTLDTDETYLNFTSAKGVEVSIYSDCLTKNGNPVTGDVVVEFAEIFDRGSMLVTNRPTMGVMNNGDKALLISGGEFYINITQGGVSLESGCSFSVQIPAALTGAADNEMILWEGTVDNEGNLAWEENVPNGQQEEGLFVEGANYYCFLQDFGWSNVDRFYNDPRPKTTILVDVPEGFDNENSAVYLSYNEEGNALAQLDTYDEETGLFSEHYGQIPIGLECHVIFVSEGDGEWIYAIKAVTIEEDGIITFTDADLDSATEAELIALINALP